ncbi:MAG: NADH-quinone oxidoreductase subunit N, partial [Rhodospirillaceae bacterium]|nr:NADH-quinone oxidoreductase subunit N [Rhodospirillaceae bacterium]
MEMNASLALPEIWVAVAGMALLIAGAFLGDRAMRAIGLLTMAIMAVAAVMVLSLDTAMPQQAFNGHFVVDSFAVFAKVLTLIAAAFAIWMSFSYAEREGMARFELPILMLLATLGMMMMISA